MTMVWCYDRFYCLLERVSQRTKTPLSHRDNTGHITAPQKVERRWDICREREQRLLHCVVRLHKRGGTDSLQLPLEYRRDWHSLVRLFWNRDLNLDSHYYTAIRLASPQTRPTTRNVVNYYETRSAFHTKENDVIVSKKYSKYSSHENDVLLLHITVLGKSTCWITYFLGCWWGEHTWMHESSLKPPIVGWNVMAFIQPIHPSSVVASSTGRPKRHSHRIAVPKLDQNVGPGLWSRNVYCIVYNRHVHMCVVVRIKVMF